MLEHLRRPSPLDSRVRWNDERWAQRPFAGMTFTPAAPGIRRSHRFARSRPLCVAKGVVACFVFLWFPASAGMTDVGHSALSRE